MKLLISDYDGTIKTYDKNPNMLEKYTFKKNECAYWQRPKHKS